MIKAGQIRKDGDIAYVITKIWYNATTDKDWADCVYYDGTTDQYSTWYIGEYHELIAEYPTWQEAVNSAEFMQ